MAKVDMAKSWYMATANIFVLSKEQCPNVSTTPLQQWCFQQCLPFSWTTHCRRPIAIMGVVDTFRQCLAIEWQLIWIPSSNVYLLGYIDGNLYKVCLFLWNRLWNSIYTSLYIYIFVYSKISWRVYFVTGLNQVLQQPSTAELAKTKAEIPKKKALILSSRNFFP